MTTNALRCQGPIWRDHSIGPKTAKNGDNCFTAPKRNMGRSACGKFVQWVICTIWGRFGPHILIIPASLSLPPMRGAAIGRALTILQNDSFFTPESPILYHLQFGRPLGNYRKTDLFSLVLTIHFFFGCFAAHEFKPWKTCDFWLCHQGWKFSTNCME